VKNFEPEKPFVIYFRPILALFLFLLADMRKYLNGVSFDPAEPGIEEIRKMGERIDYGY